MNRPILLQMIVLRPTCLPPRFHPAKMHIPVKNILAERAKYVEVSIKDLGLDHDSECTQRTFWENRTYVQMLNEYVAKHHPEIKYGDLVRVVQDYNQDAYRNDGLFIHDGTSLVDLTGKWDDYGSVPPNVQVTDTQFHPLYWTPTESQDEYTAYTGIGHNCIIFPSDKIRYLATKNITWDGETWVSRFEVRGVKWILAFETVNEDEYDGVPLEGLTDEMKEHIQAVKSKRLDLFMRRILHTDYAFDNIRSIEDYYSSELLDRLNKEAEAVHEDLYPLCLRKRWI